MVSSLLAVLLLAGVAHAKTSRIVGGQDAKIEDFPSLVQIEYYISWMGSWKQQCAGSILSPSWIVSAAHCFEGAAYSPQTTRVRAGATTRHTGGVIHYVELARNHPDYRKVSRYDGDINIVKVSTPFVYSTTVQRILLISAGFVFPDNYAMTLAGWGHTVWGGTHATSLKRLQIFTINRDLCAKRYRDANFGVVTNNMICAGILDASGGNACDGDTGGPLYAPGARGPIVAGVISWSYGCANETYPGVSTNVASYTTWIIDNAR